MQKKIIPVALATGIALSTGGQAFAASGSEIISSGEQYLGKPYYYGALVGDTAKFDCSSFVVTVFREFGINLPRTSLEQSKIGTPVSKENLQIGDLLFFDTDSDGVINHVGIYSGNGQMINSQNKLGVSYAPVFSSSYWGPSFVKAVRVSKNQEAKETPSVTEPVPEPTIPTPPSTLSVHTVKPGESLWTISKRYNVSIASIKELNQLTPDTIYPNQALKISQTAQVSEQKTPVSNEKPKTEQNTQSKPVQSSPPKEQPSPSPSIPTAQTYKVQAGDTLWHISKKFGLTIDELQKINNRTTYTIFTGQTLKVTKITATDESVKTAEPNKTPASSVTPKTSNSGASAGSYFVESGDSLWGIALEHGLSINKLMKANNLSSTVIYPKQHLVIPHF